jgi:hypothetical protein
VGVTRRRRTPRPRTLPRSPLRDPVGVAATSLVQVKTCDFCGKQGDDAETMTWVVSVENGRRKTFCDTCSRENLRAMESKLDSEWW